MYNYSYDEYMNNLLGYNMNVRNNMYITPNMVEPYEDENAITYNQQENSELEECYPDIYKIVYPMICKACLYITEEITPELVERLTNEVYEKVEQDEMPEETRSAEVKIRYNNIQNNRNMRYMPRNVELENSTEEKRQRNFLLNDLIRILIVRELLGHGHKSPRPLLF